MRQVRKSIMFFLLVSLSVLLFSCGGGGGGGESPTSPGGGESPTSPTVPNISGTWHGNAVVTESNCSDTPVGETTDVTMDITQTDSSVTATDTQAEEGDIMTFTGTISGDQLTLEGTSAEERNTIRLTVSADGRSMNGTFEVVILNPSEGCSSVKGTVTMTKQ